MGEVIAVRELEMIQDDGLEKKVNVKLEKPIQTANCEFRCYFHIEGMQGSWPKYAAGADAMQALLLALPMIGASLLSSNESKTGRLTWLGMNDLGFMPPQAPDVKSQP